MGLLDSFKIKEKLNSDIWFTSDTHFSHQLVIDPTKGKRPFRDVEIMNSTLIANWNSTVKPNDLIFHLGDFGLTNRKALRTILNKLNGSKLFVLGNHDKNHPCTANAWIQKKITIERCDGSIEKFILQHYPLAIWSGFSFHLHGHSHGKYPSQGNTLDVGVDSVAKLLGDVNDPDFYRPISLDEVIDFFKINANTNKETML